MRSGIGNSASDPLFVSGVSNGIEKGTSANPTFEKSVGSDAFATGQNASSVSPANAALIVPARAGRRSVTISNLTGSQPVFFVAAANTTGATTGFGIAGTVGASVTIPTSAAVYATSPTAAQSLSYIETF